MRFFATSTVERDSGTWKHHQPTPYKTLPHIMSPFLTTLMPYFRFAAGWVLENCGMLLNHFKALEQALYNAY